MGAKSMELDPVAIWGAALSTLLAAREVIRSRLNIEVGFTFTGDVNGLGNKIFVRNLSGKAVIITYYQVQICRKKLFRWELVDSRVEADEYFSDLIVPPHSSITLHFFGADYFDTSIDHKKKEGMFLYIVIPGRRRPLNVKIWSMS